MIAVNAKPVTPENSAIAIIRAEHRSLGYVVHTLQHLLREVTAQKAAADFELVATMLYYIGEFPDRCHHPKEDQHLFKRLRRRTALANTVLADLENQHVMAAGMLSSLEQAFVHWQAGAPQGLRPFALMADAYADFLWSHMEQEENHVIPLARKYLTTDDWLAIDLAFGANDDPLCGPHVRDEFARLKLRIVNRLPRKFKHRTEAAG